MISEIDIKDWNKTDRLVPLYHVPRDTVVSDFHHPFMPFLFAHVDGMYSLCKTLEGEVFHPAAWSKVFVWEKNEVKT